MNGIRPRTAISAERRCACPFSIAQAYAERYLLHAHPFLALSYRVTMSFSVASDTSDMGRFHDQIVLGWTSGTRLLPAFRGTIRFRIAESQTIVHIDGSYEPPLGVAGRAFDRLIGRRIAQRTLDDLLQRVTSSLEQQQREWLRLNPLLPAGP